MNRIQKKFDQLKRQNQKALIGFIVCGDPDIETSKEIILQICEAGVDIIELGVPFSDPTADGPVIQRAAKRALTHNTSLSSVLKLARELRQKVETPIILFSYYNPLFKFGAERFYREAVNAGIDGLLVVDLPPEESGELIEKWSGNELSFIRLIAPTTPEKRIQKIVNDASGFIYLISKTGITGSEGLDFKEISNMVQKIKKYSDLPVCVGFGVSTEQEVKKIASLSDGVIIGSAIIRTIEKYLDDIDILKEELANQIKSYKKALY